MSLDQLHQSFADNHQATLEQVSTLQGHAAALKNSLNGSSNNVGHNAANISTPRKSISFEDEVRRAPGADQSGEGDGTNKRPTPTYSSTAELLASQSKSSNRRQLNDQDDDDDDDEDYVPPTSEDDDDDELDLGETMYEDELKATKRTGRRQSDGEVKKVKGKKKKKKGADGLIGRSRSSSATDGRSRSRSRSESMLSRQVSTMD